MLFPSLSEAPLSSIALIPAVTIASALLLRIIYNLYWHPLARYPGPWYAASFSLSAALISVLKLEPYWLQSLVKKYGSKTHTHHINSTKHRHLQVCACVC